MLRKTLHQWLRALVVRKPRRPLSNRPDLLVETLELRATPDAKLSFSADFQTLIVEGDAGANQFSVTRESFGYRVQASGSELIAVANADVTALRVTLDANQRGATVPFQVQNASSQPVDITALRVLTKGGVDQFQFSSSVVLQYLPTVTIDIASAAPGDAMAGEFTFTGISSKTALVNISASTVQLSTDANLPFQQDTALTVTQNVSVIGRNLRLQAETVAIDAGLATTGTGSIDVVGQKIFVGAGVQVSAGPLGDVKMQAADGLDLVLLASNPFLRDQDTQASLNVAANAKIQGRNITLSADANSSKFLDLETNTIDAAQKLAAAQGIYRGTGQVTFAPGTITRSDGKAWDTVDSFNVGDSVLVSDTLLNNGLYEITAIAGSVLTVSADLNRSSKAIVAETIADPIVRVADVYRGPATFTANGNATLDTISIPTGSLPFTKGQALFVYKATAAANNLVEAAVDSVAGGSLAIAAPVSVTSATETNVIIAAEKVQLVGLVRADPNIGMTGAPTLTFNAANRTITRSAGDWASDGFVAPGLISVRNSAENDAIYRVLSVNGSTLQLDLSSTLFNETTSDSQIVGVLADAPGAIEQEAGVALQGAPSLTFDPATRTVTRSAGSWASDGFAPGKMIQITGTADNDGSYLVRSVAGANLVLDGSTPLKAETAANATVVGVKLANATALESDKVAQVTSKILSTKENAQKDGTVGAKKDGLIRFAAVDADAASSVQIRSGVEITATGDVSITAAAQTKAKFKNSSYNIGITWGSSNASAETVVDSGAIITAGGLFDLQSRVRNLLDVQTNIEAGSQLNAPTAVAITYGSGRSNSLAEVRDGAQITAQNVSVVAVNNNDFNVASEGKPLAEGTFSKKTSANSQAIGLSYSDMKSTATANLGGTVISHGDAEVRAESINVRNNVRSFAFTKDGDKESSESGGLFNPALLSKFAAKFNSPFIQDLFSKADPEHESTDATAAPANPAEQPRFGFSAAVAVAISENTAIARLGAPQTGQPKADIQADGSIHVSSLTEDNYKAASVGSAGSRVTFAIGGAVTWGDYENHADASVEPGVHATAGREVTVDSETRVPDQITVKQDLDAFLALLQDLDDFKASADAITDDVGAVDKSNLLTDGPKALVDAVTPHIGKVKQMLVAKDVLQGLKDYIGSPAKIVSNKIANTFSGANAQYKTEFDASGNSSSPGAKLTGSGSLTFLSVSNEGTATIGAGAVINAGATLAKSYGITSTNAATNSVVAAPSGIREGDALTYQRGLIDIGGLTDGSTYYAVNDVHGALHLTDGIASTFDPASTVQRGKETLDLGYRHDWTNGQAVLYRADGAPIAGLVDGEIYYVIVVTPSIVQLASSAANAQAAQQINGLDGRGLTGKAHRLIPLVSLTSSLGSFARLAPAAVRVHSQARMTSIDIGGLGPLNSTSGGAFSIGASVLITDKTNSAKASIADGVAINVAHGDVQVVSLADTVAFNIVLAGSQGQKFVGSGSVGINLFDNQSLAWIEPTANLTVNDGGLQVLARGKAFSVDVSGAISVGANALGIAAAVKDYDSDVRAFVGDVVANNAFTARGTIAVAGAVQIDASARNRFFDFAIAGSIAKDVDPPQPGLIDKFKDSAKTFKNQAVDKAKSLIDNLRSKAPTADPEQPAPAPSADLPEPAQQATENAGLGISAAVGFMDLDTTVEAYIRGATVTTRLTPSSATAGDIAIKATGDTFIVGVDGAVALAKSATANTTSGAGAANVVLLGQSVRAFAEDASLAAINVFVKAESPVSLFFVAAGGAGGNPKTQTKAISGSVNVGYFQNLAEAYLGSGTRLANVFASGAVTIDASSPLRVVNAAGGVSIGGDAVGAAVQVLVFTNSALAYVGANSTINADGDIHVKSNTTETLDGIAAQLAGSLAGLGLEGTVSIIVANINNQAKFGDGAVVTAGGKAEVLANDEIDLLNVAGGFALGTKAAGAAVAIDVFHRTVIAKVGNDARLTASGAGGIAVTATADDAFLTLAIGAAVGTQGITFEASALIDYLQSETLAQVGDRAQAKAVHAAGSVAVTATHNSVIHSGAGSLAAGKGPSVGAAVDVQILDKTTKATLGVNGVVEAGKDVSLSADAEEEVKAGAAAGGGSLSGFTGAGSAMVVDLTKDTEAIIGNNARVDASGNVLVLANSDGDFNTGAGAGALALGGVGVAGSVLVLDRDDVVKARIGTNADVTGRGLLGTASVPTGEYENHHPVRRNAAGVIVAATSSEDLLTIVAGLALSGTTGALAGSIIITTETEETTAFIDAGAKINKNDDGAATQNVFVVAGDDTKRISVAGGAGGGASGGVGLGIDVAVTTKTTDATVAVGAQIKAQETILVQALNEEEVRVVAASLGIGGTGGGAGSAGVTDNTINTRARVLDGGATRTLLQSQGNVVVSADDRYESDYVVGAGAGGGTAGLGGSLAVIGVTKETIAQIGANADVIARANRAAVNVRTSQFTPRAESQGDKEVAKPDLDLAGTTNSDTDTKLGPRANAPSAGPTPTTASYRGLVVTATAVDDVETVTASGAVGGTIGFTLAGSIYLLGNTTRAAIGAGAKVNDVNAGAGSEQQVLVGAGYHLAHLGAAGAASGGGSVGAGVGGNVSMSSNATEATIGNATVRAARDIIVSAAAHEEILTLGVGLGVGGVAGIAGSFVALVLDNTTLATVAAGATLDAGGNVIVSAIDVTESDNVVGSVGIGFKGGVGASVGVVLVTKDTEAAIGNNATIDAKGNGGDFAALAGGFTNGFTTAARRGVIVQAGSREELLNVAVSGAGGLFVGVAGGIEVDTVTAKTIAAIGANANINQNNAGANAAQDVVVVAVQSLDELAVGGGLGIGAVGIAGGVSAGVFKYDTKALIGDGTKTKATDDIVVSAVGERTIESVVVSSGAGVVGVAGAVAVYSMGTGPDSGDSNNLNTQGGGSSAQGFAGDQLQGQSGNSQSDGSAKFLNEVSGSLGSATDGADTAKAQAGFTRAGTRLRGAANGKTINLSATNAQGTVAQIGVGGTTDAGDSVLVSARETIVAFMTAGSSASGAASVGGSVIVLTIADNVQASLGGDVKAGGKISVLANYDATVNGFAFGGSAGLVGLGAQVVIVKDRSVVQALIANGTTLNTPSTIEVVATTTRNETSAAKGASVGGLAGGAAIGEVHITGATRAKIGNAVSIGGATQGSGNVEVRADASNTAKADVLAVAAGIGAGAGNKAEVDVLKDNDAVEAAIGDGGAIFVSGDVTVATSSTQRGEADAIGVAVGALAFGISQAFVNVGPDVRAAIGTSTVRAGRRINVNARHNANADGTPIAGTPLSAESIASGGGLAAASGGVAEVHHTTDVAATSQASGNAETVNIIAIAIRTAPATAGGVTLGGLGIGVMIARSDVEGDTTASIGGKMAADNLTTLAADSSNGKALTIGATGGVLAVGVNIADVKVAPVIRAMTLPDAYLTASDTALVQAISDATATADTIGVNIGALSVASSESDVNLSPTVKASLGNNSQIHAGNIATVEARLTRAAADSEASASSGTLYGLGFVKSAVMQTSDVGASLGDGAVLSALNAANVLANAKNQITNEADAFTAGIAAGQDATTKEDIRTTAQVALGTASVVNVLGTGGKATIKANNQVIVATTVETKFLGGLSLNFADADTTIRGVNDQPLALVTFGQKSQVEAEIVAIDARVDALNVDSKALGEQRAAGGYIRTTSKMDVTSNTEIRQQTGSAISGETVTLYSGQDVIRLVALGRGEGFGVICAHDGQTFQTVNLNSKIIVEAGAAILANVMRLETHAADGSDLIKQDTERDSFGIDPASDDFALTVRTKNEVNIAGTLVDGVKWLELQVDAAGAIAKNKGYSVQIVGNNVIIQGLDPDASVGSTSLIAPTPTPSLDKDGTPDPDIYQASGEVIFGAGAERRAPDRIKKALVVNASSKDLRIDDFNMSIPGSLGALTIVDGNNSPSGTLASGPIFKVINPNATIISNAQTASDLVLNGVLNNPYGTTNLLIGGSITASGAAAVIKTSDLTLNAKIGIIGTLTAPLQSTIDQDADRLPAPRLAADASGAVAIKLLPATTSQTILVPSLTSNFGDIDLAFAGNNMRLTGVIRSLATGAIRIAGMNDIIDDHTGTDADILTTNLTILGTGNFGTKSNPLETTFTKVEGESTLGGIFLANRAGFTVGGIDPVVTGLKAGGGLEVRGLTTGAVSILESILAGGDIIVSAADGSTLNAENITLTDGVTIESQNGGLALLAGDNVPLNATHRLKALNGEITLGYDQGNADPGEATTLTIPEESLQILRSKTLRIITDSDAETLLIPNMYIPTTWEAGGNFDVLSATLDRAVSNRTSVTAIQVEKVTFQVTQTQDVNWTFDTTDNAQIALFSGVTKRYLSSQLSANVAGQNLPIVSVQNDRPTDFAAIDGRFTFSDGKDDLKILRTEFPLTINLAGGDDTARLGGMRQIDPANGNALVPAIAVSPAEASSKITIDAAVGTDVFKLEDLVSTGVTPVGRLDRLDAATGMVRDYDREQESPQTTRVTLFSGFENTEVNFGAHSSIFSVLNTVTPTTINAGAGADTINLVQVSHLTHVNLEGGDDGLNVQGIGDLVIATGGTNTSPSDTPDTGDRVRIGVTRTFTHNEINTQLNAGGGGGLALDPGHIGIYGHGWFDGQEVIFTTSGTAPKGLNPGQSYYVIREDRNFIRLATTKTNALAHIGIAINTGELGLGESQLTMAKNGVPLWGRSLTAFGTDNGQGNGTPSFFVSQPGSERAVTFNANTDKVASVAAHGLVDGQRIGFVTEGSLPGNLRSDLFYYVINATPTTFELSLTKNGTPIDLTNNPGSGKAWVVTIGELRLEGRNANNAVDFEKANVLLGSGDDTFVLQNSADNLQMEIRGNAGDDTFVLRSAKNTAVLRGDAGANDTIKVVVEGAPQANQFAGLQIGAGIERLLVDNSDNPNPVNWFVTEGSLSFGRGAVLTPTLNIAGDTFTAAGHGLTTGDRVLLSSTGAMPVYEDATQIPAVSRSLEKSAFLYAIVIDANTFKLAASPGEAAASVAVDFTSAGSGVLAGQKLALLVGLEGAATSEIVAGRSDVTGDGKPDVNGAAISSLTVLSSLELAADINGNHARLVEGLRVLDHENTLSKVSFPAFRVDGLQGVKDVATVTTDDQGVTRQWIIGAGTAEDKLAIFERRADAQDPSFANLEFVSVMTTLDGVPIGPKQLAVSADGKFLYVVGSTEVAVFVIGQSRGLLKLTRASSVADTGSDFILSSAGDLAFITKPTGIVIYDRNAGSGALTARQTITEASVGAVGNGPVKGLQNPTALVVAADGKRFFVGDAQGGVGTFERDLGGVYKLVTKEEIADSKTYVQLKTFKILSTFDSDNADELFIQYLEYKEVIPGTGVYGLLPGDTFWNPSKNRGYAAGVEYAITGDSAIKNTATVYYEFREEVGGAADNSYGAMQVSSVGFDSPLVNTSEIRTEVLGTRLEVKYEIFGPKTTLNQALAFAANGAVSAMTLSPDGKALYVATASGKLYTLGNTRAIAADSVQLDSVSAVNLGDSAGDRVFVDVNGTIVSNADGAQVLAQNGSTNLSSLSAFPVTLQGQNVILRVGRWTGIAPSYTLSSRSYAPDSSQDYLLSEITASSLTAGAFSVTFKEGGGGNGELQLTYTVTGGSGINLTQLDLEENNLANVTGLASPQAIRFSADGQTLYVTGKTIDGASGVGSVASFQRAPDNNLTYGSTVKDGLAKVKGLGNLVVGAATEATFGPAGAFADFAGTDKNALVSFAIDPTTGLLTIKQGPDRDAMTSPYGTGDGNPAGQATSVQGLIANPVYKDLYLVSPVDANLYMLTDVANSGKTFYRVTGFFHDESENVTALKGAAAIAVSPNGAFIYVLSPGEDDLGNRIAIFQRRDPAVLQPDDDPVVFVGSMTSNVMGVYNPNSPPRVRSHVSPDGKALYVAGPLGLEVFAIALDGSLQALQTLPGAKYNLADFADVPNSTLTYAVSPSANALLLFDRAADGTLTNERSFNTRLDAPMSVVVSPEVTAGSVVVPAGRHLYVASAGNSSISVFVDPANDGNLTYLQMVREGTAGIRGLEGVSAIRLSDAVADTSIGQNTGDPEQISGSQIDADNNVFTIEFHGLRTGQKIRFDAVAPAGLSAGRDYWIRTLNSNAFQVAETEADARNPLGAIVDLQPEAGDKFTLRTSIAAGAYFYAVGTLDDSIATFERNDDPFSASFGKLTFLQVIKNRIGNQTSGSNDGLYHPDSIVAIPGDTTRVFVSSLFDPLVDNAAGGLVTFTNNPNNSPQLPPVELNIDFRNMAAFNIFTGVGNDRINVIKAPRTGSDATNTSDPLIALTIDTGSGNDEVALNDVGASTAVKLGDGDDTFTVRRKAGVDPTVDVEGGAGDDQFNIASVEGGLTVNIDPGAGNDTASIDASGVETGSQVNFLNSDPNDVFRIESGGAAPTGQAGSQYQVAGFGTINVGAASVQSLAGFNAVAGLSANDINEGDGVTLDAAASLIPQTGGRVEYAWDLNRDGAFTEMVTSAPTKALSWLDVRDYILGTQSVADVVEFRIPLRVTYSVDILDANNEVIGVDRRVSFDEVDLAIHDVLPTLFVQGDAATILAADRPPYSLKLTATDPADDFIVQWTVAWGDGQTDLYSTDPEPTHRYDKPGVYTIQVTGIDNENHLVTALPKQVTVTFDPSLINPGGPYSTLEAHGITLDGSAFGAVDANSYRWTVNGQAAGTGSPLSLTWQELNNLGVTNDGVYDVRLTATYNSGADVVTSNAVSLTVVNVLPTAKFRSTGTIDEGSPAQVFFTDVADAVDTNFTYSYDFGNGVWVAGSATQTVPPTAEILRKGGSNTILGRVFDGTDYALYETEIIVRELPPSLLIDQNQRVVTVDEGAFVELRGDIVSPGNDPVTLTASIGTVVEDAAGRWRWSFTPDDGPADSQTVTITATDDAGLPGSITFDLLVINHGPAVQFVNSGPVNEGSSATVTFQNVLDPSAADQAAGFTYSYDFGDGVFVPGGASAIVPASLLEHPGQVTIRGKVTDKDGYTIYETTLDVVAVAPALQTPTFTTQPNKEGSDFILEAVFTDPGLLNFHRVRIAWGDETFDFLDIPEGGRSFSATHRYLDNSVLQASGQNTYAVNVTVFDDSNLSSSQTITATVNNEAPQTLTTTVPGAAPSGYVSKITGSFTDAGSNDHHTVQIQGSDGTQVIVEVGGRDTIDFEKDAAGNSLADGQGIFNQFLASGNRGFTVSTGEPNITAIIFNSTAPTGGETDLGTPNSDFGGPGVGVHGKIGETGINATALGKILVISDGNTSNPGARDVGGMLIFDFPTAVFLDSIDLVNIASLGNVIETYSTAGLLIGTTAVPTLGDNSVQRVFLNQDPKVRKGVEGMLPVARMIVRLTGEGGVARLDFRYANANQFAAVYKPQASADVVGYVESLYVDLLGRSIDPSGYASFKIPFERGAVTREAIAFGLVTSAEFHAKFVREMYPRLLGRPADAAGLAGWTDALNRGASTDQVEAQIMGTSEYFAKQGNTTDGFLDAIFNQTLGRLPTALERTDTTQLLNLGTSRSAVVRNLQQSREGLERQLGLWYSAYVQQTIPSALATSLADSILNGQIGTPQALIRILATDAYFSATQTSTPHTPVTLTITVTDDDGGSVQTQATGPTLVRGYVESLYADLLGRAIDPTGVAVFKKSFEQGSMTRADVVNGIMNSQEYREIFVRNLYRTILLREGDNASVAVWVRALASGQSFADIENGFYESAEYSQRFGDSDEHFLNSLYADLFDRDLDATGLANWTQQLNHGTPRAAVVRAMSGSAEAIEAKVHGLYDTYLRRLPESGVAALWSAAVRSGQIRVSAIVIGLLTSDEYFAATL